MVSKASEDLPEPETPETTVSLPWVRSQSMFFRLWVRAPRIVIRSFNVSTSKLAVDLLGGRCELSLKAGLDAGEHLLWVALLGLLVGGSNVTSQIGEHHSPGFGFLPHAHAQADVLILMRDPDTQQFEGFGVGAHRFGYAELIGLSHGSPLGGAVFFAGYGLQRVRKKSAPRAGN